MTRIARIFLGIFCAFLSAKGCGLDGALLQVHFEGVDEQGLVAYPTLGLVNGGPSHVIMTAITIY